jgi:cyanophycinase-like exopeptidase
VAILETPAGFQPNAAIVAQELGEIFQTSLKEFVTDVTIIPARKKGTEESPDNEALLTPLERATYIVLGPGSPTYAVKQLQDSKALSLLKKQWQKGATLVLSSAAAIAAGESVLPVYEIYKAGSDFYWEKGLDLFSEFELPLSILTHWDNTDGGEKLDTSHCFMGANRFKKIYELFPHKKPLLCIDEHTAALFYFSDDIFVVKGKGTVIVFLNGKQTTFENGKAYSISKMIQGNKEEKILNEKKDGHKKEKNDAQLSQIPEAIQELLKKRKQAKLAKDFAYGDRIRAEIEGLGFIIEDSNGEQKVLKENA